MKYKELRYVLPILVLYLFEECLGMCPPGMVLQNGSTVCTEIQCNIGQYYDATLKQCMSCDSTCSQCKFFSNNCSECKSGFYLFKQTCNIQCPQMGTYVSCTNGVCQCKPCHSSCVQCFGEKNTQCLRCNSPYYYNQVNNSCMEECESGYKKTQIIVGENTISNCTVCDDNCKQCDQLDDKKCLSCKDNMYLYKDKCIATCPTGYFKNLGTCKQCPTNCQECYQNGISDSDILCLSCAKDYVLNVETQQCQVSCGGGFTYDKVKLQCVPCHPSCKNCQDPNMESCTTCQSGFNLISGAPSTCENSCKAGFYSSNTSCLTCNTSCSECFGSDNKQCIKCKQDYFLNQTECVVICPISYFYAKKFSDSSIQPICDYCPPEMEQCEQNANLIDINPILCKKGYYLQDGKCVKTCKDLTFYTDENLRICAPCKFPCLQCLSDSLCLTCASRTINDSIVKYTLAQITKNSEIGVVFQQNCVASCPKGFYTDPNTQKCSQCNSSCQTCTGGEDIDCINCQKYDDFNQLFKSNKKCYYTCPQSISNPMYGDKLTSQCLPCSSECTSCFQGDNKSCYSCSKGYYLEYLKPECKSFCEVEGTYKNDLTQKCTLCGYGCKTCTDGSFNSCITCQDGYYLQPEYEVCKPCPKQCSLCTSDDVCQACSSGYFYISSQKACVLTCPLDGYFTNTSTNTCEQCHSTCQECYGSGADQCINCPKGSYYDISGKCLSCNSCDDCTGPNITDCLNTIKCPPNQYLFDGKCLTCFDNCQSCSGITFDSCIACKNQNDYSLLFDVCKKKSDSNDQQCDIGFFFDLDSKQCNSCHKNCIECVGKSSSQCTRCAEGYLLHKSITTCSSSCLDGYVQTNQAVAECQECVYNCTTGCSQGFSFLLGLCFTNCPFGTTSASNKCIFNNKPSIQFSKIIGNDINSNSEAVKIQLHVYAIKSYSIVWSLYESGVKIDSSSPLQKYIQNRDSYVVFPQKSLKSGTSYKIKASIFDTSTSCKTEDDCKAEQTFTTAGDITPGSFNIDIDTQNQLLTAIVSGWKYGSSSDSLLIDIYVKLTGNDYFFFEKGLNYSDGRFTYLLPSLNFELTGNKAQFFLVVYNDYDIQIITQNIALNISRLLAAVVSIDISEFIDTIYNQISTIQQIQRASYQFYTQMLNLISSQTSSTNIYNRHLFYQAYYSIKGLHLQCDPQINCSGHGTCSWNEQNANEVLCQCTQNYSGRYCEFESFQLDVAKQHLVKLVEKLSNIDITQKNDIFLSIETLINLTSFFSIFDEFTLNTVIQVYFNVFDQLKRIQTHISDEKILFKISKLTTQLIHLVNEIETLSYDDQQALLTKTMNAFDTQINLFLINFADSYDDLRSQEKIQTSYQTDISHIAINLLYENDLLDMYIKNQDINPDEQQGNLQLSFEGDKISYLFDLNQFSPKTSLSTAVIKWNSNPFLSISQYQAPFISCITRLIVYSEETLIEISTVDTVVEIAIPKILPTPILRTSRSYLQPYTCVYFDQIAQVYKQDGVSYLRENSTHVICTSEQISGNYGVIVNNMNIDSSLSLSEIWNATSSLYSNDKTFQEFMKKQISKQDNVDNQVTVTESEFNPNLQLLYAILLYVLVILLFILISILRDKRDKEYQIKESDSYWLIHPIYSLLCGPYSTFFPRLSRSLNFAQAFINYFLYNAIFVRVYEIPSEEELNKNPGRRQIINFTIGITSVALSILTYYLTICVINFFKMRWYINQKWLDFKEDKITNDIIEQIIKSLKGFQLMNYGLIFLLQIGMGVPIIILILTQSKQESQFFFSSLFVTWVIDNIFDTVILIGFCVIRIFSKSEKSNIVLFFTLRGFYFPSSEFYQIENKIKQYQDHGEIKEEEEEEEQANLSGNDIFDINDYQTGRKIFQRNEDKNKGNQEEVQLTEFVNKLETKM